MISGLTRTCLLLLLFSHSVTSNSATPWTVACQAPLSIEFSRNDWKIHIGVDCHFLLQRIFSIQELNPQLLQVSCTAGRFSTTEPPGKSYFYNLIEYYFHHPFHPFTASPPQDTSCPGSQTRSMLEGKPSLTVLWSIPPYFFCFHTHQANALGVLGITSILLEVNNLNEMCGGTKAIMRSTGHNFWRLYRDRYCFEIQMPFDNQLFSKLLMTCPIYHCISVNFINRFWNWVVHTHNMNGSKICL